MVVRPSTSSDDLYILICIYPSSMDTIGGGVKNIVSDADHLYRIRIQSSIKRWEWYENKPAHQGKINNTEREKLSS